MGERMCACMKEGVSRVSEWVVRKLMSKWVNENINKRVNNDCWERTNV